MACNCIKREDQSFDIVVNTYDCKALIITDTSNWMVDSNYSIPENHKVSVVLPNKSTVDIEIKPNSTAKVFSSSLFGTECLPDGIYCFKTTSCGYSYSRNKAVVCTLRCKLDDFISKASSDSDWSEINRISNMIDLIEVEAEMGNEINANEIFKIVNKELDKHSCTCLCR